MQTVEEILFEAEKLGIRQEVLNLAAKNRKNAPYRRDLKSQINYIEEAFMELSKNKSLE